ncbi:MAG: hypothetical protein JF592_18460 [Microbacterium sp.]|uniref:hypothetical protein n=1 Tax=Microbacterium sp. TaxID=51671 RepID=UPI001D3F92EA|nr:hypothetical protein [Microbacterium sp.]MBW8764532.1 hypothetical protein [Microbacterium sp.]
MARVGRTLTGILTIETRQHELFGIELGEGPKRKTILLGFLIAGLWFVFSIPFTALLGLWANLDVAPFGFALVIAPPAVLLALGLRPQEAIPTRIVLVSGALRVRYAISGHRPLIRLGARRPSRHEQIPRSARIAYLLPKGRDTQLPAVGVEQRPIGMHWKTRMYGRDYQQVLTAWMNRKAK